MHNHTYSESQEAPNADGDALQQHEGGGAHQAHSSASSFPSKQKAQNQVHEEARTRRCAKLRIPQTAIFRDGILKVWYVSEGGTIRRKSKKNLDKSILLREIIKKAKPGSPVALLVCSQAGGDGMTTTCTSVLDEGACTKLVKNAFSTHMNCMLQGTPHPCATTLKMISAQCPSNVPMPRRLARGRVPAALLASPVIYKRMRTLTLRSFRANSCCKNMSLVTCGQYPNKEDVL
jgi:hypothetical protein